MKYILSTLLVVAIGVGTIILGTGKIPVTSTPTQGNEAAQVVQSPTPLPVGKPVTLKIPTLGVEAVVEEVGMEEDGRMGVPQSAYTTGWWKLGVKPGEVGSAVIAGHLDAPDGSAGVFYDISRLGVGEEIAVTDASGHNIRFTVTKIELYPDAAFPIDQVFADMTGRYLNLITCAGTWDSQAKNYQDRLVVYSVLDLESDLY